MTKTSYMGLDTAYNLGVLINPSSPITITYKVTTAAGVDAPLEVVSTPTLQNYR